LLESGDMKEFQQLDETCLAGKAFLTRADLYARAERLVTNRPFAGGRLVGLKGEPLEKFLKDSLGVVREEAKAYTGKLANEAKQVVEYQLKRVEKVQSDGFFAAYLAEANKELGARTGFPLVRNLEWMTKPDSFMAAAKHLKYVSDDLASPIFQKYALRDRSDEWKKFIPSVEGQQTVAKALLGGESTMGPCVISLAGATDATRPEDGWRETWRNIKLIVEGGNTETISTGSAGDEKIGDAPIPQKFELRLYKNINDPTSPIFPIQTAEWGPLWLIHKYKGERDKTDPKTWLVKFPVGAQGATGSLRLKLKFERVLPEFDEWPLQ
jgi:hypothetical protein